jgi:uncharacterized repeat protein (TIGR01451 family)
MVVTNTGGSALTNASLTDQVNGMTSLVLTASPGSCSQSAGNVTCSMPSGKSLAGGGTWTVTIKGTVTAAAGTTLNNSATATATRSSTTFTASASASVQVTGSTGGSLPDLTVSINAPTSVVTNGSLPYTLTVNNIGAANATGVEVDDTLPAGVTFVNASGTSLFTCSFSSPTIKCTGGAVSAGGNATITINTTAPGTTGSITDTAVVDPTCTNATESNCSNNNATFATTVTNPPPPPAPDLTITITAPTNVTLCNTAGCTTSIAYTLTVTNAGNATAPASILEVDDTLPAAITSATTSGTGGYTCTVTVPGVKCNTGTGLDAGASATIKINGSMPFGTPTGTATDTAQVDPTCTSATESNCSNNNASATTTLSNATTTGTLTLQATAATTADPNGTIVAQPVDGKLTYTLVIHNTSSSRADSVVLTDGTQGLDASRITATPDAASIAEGVKCVINAPQVTCSAGGPTWRINAGATATVTIVGYTVTQAGTQISATGTVLIDTATVTGNISNVGQTSTASVTTTVVPSIELNLTQTSSSSSSSTANSAHAAADLVYTITVGNSGFYNANPVEVRVPLPAGVLRRKVGGSPLATFTLGTDYTTNGGFTCSIDSSNVVDCTGGTVPGFGPSTSPAANTRTITLNLVAPETTGNISDTATVNPHNTIPESDYTDNSFALTTAITTGVDLCVPPGGGTSSGCPAASVVTYCPFLAPGPLDCSTTPKGVATASRLTYVIKVPNQGTQDTTGVVVQDTLPTGVTFISATGDHNLLCSASSLTVTCTGGIINGTYTQDTSTLYPTYPANFPPSPANTDVATITIVVFSVNNPGTMTNKVSVDPASAISEFDKTNNVNTLTTPAAYGGANPYIDLSITKVQKSPTTPPNNVAQHGILTYELTISNDTTANPLSSLSPAEEQTATNVAVKDFVPAGAVFISVTAAPLTGGSGGFQCSETPLFGQPSAGELDCTNGTLAPGGSTTIDVTMYAPPAGAFMTQATVDPNNLIAEGDETNNTVQLQTTAVDEPGTTTNGAYIDLTLAMVADHGTGAAPYNQHSVVPGGAVGYTLTVTNLGSGNATSVEVKDTLPTAGTTFVSAQDSAPASPGAYTCSQAVSGTIDCTGGTVPGSGGTRTIVIVVNAPNQTSNFPQGNGNDITITNQAIVNPSDAIPESTLLNNTALWETTVHPNVNLSITKSGPGSAGQGDTVTYTITATLKCDLNTADQPCLAQNVQVTDPFPVELIPMGVKTSPSGGSSSSSTLFSCQFEQNPVNVLSCSGDLAPDNNGTEVDVQIIGTFFVTATDGSLVEPNRACIDPNNLIIESNETDNCSTAPAFPVGHIDLLIVKTGPTGIIPGQTVTYTVTVSNIGTLPTDGSTITVTDNLGTAGLVPDVDQTPTLSGFTCNMLTKGTANQTLSCTDSSALAAGASASMTFTAEFPTSSPPPTNGINNTATVSGGGEQAQYSGNNSSTAFASAQAPTLDLSVSQPQASPQQAYPSSTLTFAIPAANLGPQAATKSGGVTVKNTISFGASNLNGLSYDGSTSGGTNGWSCDATMSVSGGTGTINCNNPSGMGPAGTQLSPSDKTVLTLKFVVGQIAAGSQITLTSQIDPNLVYPEDTNQSNNTASVSVNMLAACPTNCPDLTATMTVDQSAVTLHYETTTALDCPFNVPCYIDSATLTYTATVAEANAAPVINPSGMMGAGNGAVWVWIKPDSNLTYNWAGATITGAYLLTGHTPTCFAPGSVPMAGNAPSGDGACNFDLAGSSAATITLSASAPTSIFSTHPYPSPVTTEVDISNVNSPDPTPDSAFTATASTTVTTVDQP